MDASVNKIDTKTTIDKLWYLLHCTINDHAVVLCILLPFLAIQADVFKKGALQQGKSIKYGAFA